MRIDYFAHLEPGCFYHIYNQGNARIRVFYKDENYSYFLKKADTYLFDFVEIYSYCILSNHFHMLIRIREGSKILENAKKTKELERFLERNSKEDDLSGLVVSEMFRRLFMSYAKAINKQEKRTGSLFRKNFKRKKINNIDYLIKVVIYIHRNPEHHGIRTDFRDYPWSSYHRILEDNISKLRKEEVLGFFEDRQNFIDCHLQSSEYEGIEAES